MREPAATVIEAAFTSPTMTPVESTSTCLAASILPWSSPPTTTTPARTWPSSLAPASMRILPSTCTSPLKRPAMRTSPPPTILPSMASSAAITDSTPAARAGARRAASAAGAGSAVRSGALCNSVTLDEPPAAGVPLADGLGFEPVSFQSAMSGSSSYIRKRKKPRYCQTPIEDHCLALETSRILTQCVRRIPVSWGMAEARDRPKSRSLRPLRALLPFLRPHGWILSAALGALVVAAGAMLAVPVAMRQLIDHGLVASNVAVINRYFLGFLAAAVVFGIFAALRFYLVTWLGER